MESKDKDIRWFSEIDKDDIALVGGKGANLGEMVSFGIPVPPGFVVTAPAYFRFLDENNLRIKIKKELLGVDKVDPLSYTFVSKRIKKLILQGKIPRDLSLEIMKSYLRLGQDLREERVAIRSSATAEDLPTASFAGQQVTFLNVTGEANVVKKVHECWASLFEPRAIFYREQNNFDHFRVGIAVPVQKMVQSHTSGVMFTIDPITLQKNTIVIEAIYGLGEMIVQGVVTPDHYVVNKNTLKILRKQIFKQSVQLTFQGVIKTPKSLQEKQKITNRQIVQIAEMGKKIHQHYYFPQDIEWAIEKGKIYILQTRPVTTLNREVETSKDETSLSAGKDGLGRVLLTGTPASPGIATGKVRKIASPREINQVKQGDILVTTMTTPDFVPAMKKTAAIVTDQGGQTSHAAIVSRELGIPCVVGTGKATKILKNNDFVTVNGKTGEIYEVRGPLKSKMVLMTEKLGFSPPLINEISPKTATKIYVNLAEPDLAAEISKKNVDGVGLARAEFMVAQMGVHPKKLIHERKQKLFVNSLVKGLKTFCEHFNPRPVIYRATDFKTNEYRSLIGGKFYEPEEPNPMLGYRGAYRYITDSAIFELELEAIKKVREEFKNLYLMIPFVHLPWELTQVKKIVASKGLLRSPSFKLWMMVEIPSNVVLLEDFIKVGIDGVSIGSNDLTMLMLGVDRDNSEVARVFNENNPAVLWAIEKVIKTCHQYKITCSICGQAPSQYPDLVEKLVEWGITSISVNPDVLDSVRRTVYEAEAKLLTKR